MINYILSYGPELMSGVWLTLELTLCSLVFGFILSMFLTFSMLSPHGILRGAAQSFVFIFRGSPLLVQIFLLYYGISQFPWLRESWLWPFFREPFWCAILALSLNSSAYMTVIFHSVIKNISVGEVSVAKTLGFSAGQIFRLLQFPQALRYAWNSFSNEIILLVKATGLASTIALLDILGITKMLIAENYETITGFAVAGILYLLLTACLLGVLKVIKMSLREPL